VLSEEAGRLDQESGGGRAALVGQELAEGDLGAVVDGRVKVVVADPPAATGRCPAVGTVAAAVGDAAQLLDVQVDQLPGPLALVADDRAAVRSVWARRLMPWRRRIP
jgi:hypothetical protein